MRRLAVVDIKGLLGRFDHHIVIPEDWEFLILHGPNGVGKTQFLEVISNTFRFRPSVLAALPFTTVSFQFSDGLNLTVSKASAVQLPLDREISPSSEDSSPPLRYILTGLEPDPIVWELARPRPDALITRRLRDAERYLPVELVAPDLWVDQLLGDQLSASDLLDRYADDLPFDIPGRTDVPALLKTFLEEFHVHLIETQRLFTFESAPSVSVRPMRRPRQRLTVQRFADDLTRQIAETLARNSRTSQELDRTFPRRILSSAPEVTPAITDAQIRRRYESQSELRRHLADIAVLDSSTEMQLPDRPLEAWERRVLWTYLNDSEEKLSTFQRLLDRVQLLREVVNSRFLFKELQIDAERGFRFVTEQDDDLSPDQLSSGEQHELVLLYDLLFKVEPNSLVLVDEPEISLHVVWQQEFLNDIKRIATLGDLQFVIATHSPQIIHTWWARAFALYPGEGGLGPDA